MNGIVLAVHQTIIFLLEIAMYISFGYYGMSQSWNLLPGKVGAISLIVITVFLWAVYAAPKSGKRLKMPFLAIFRATLFLIASFLLFQVGQKSTALIFAGLTIITQITSYFTEKRKSQ